MNILLVMIGGFFGSIARYSVGAWFSSNEIFPFATLLVNLIGCFLLAWLLTTVSNLKKLTPEISLFFGTGFIGSFTTFSTFSLETMQLIQDGHYLLSIIYVTVSISFGLILAFAGYKLALLRKEGEVD